MNNSKKKLIVIPVNGKTKFALLEIDKEGTVKFPAEEIYRVWGLPIGKKF